MTMAEIKDFIKNNFDPVDDKPGFVWFDKRNFQIISIETLEKHLKDPKKYSCVNHLEFHVTEDGVKNVLDKCKEESEE